MHIYELNEVTDRLNAIVKQADDIAMTREEVLEEIKYLARIYKARADRLDKEIDKQYQELFYGKVA
jgi:hypothetical protein